MAFSSDHPNLSKAACGHIDLMFPPGSQSRGPHGSLSLERIAALGYSGIHEGIAASPVQLRRQAGQYGAMLSPAGEAEALAAEICLYLTAKGLQVAGWPLPPTRYAMIHPFSGLADRQKAEQTLNILLTGKRAFIEPERRWLADVLRAIATTQSYPPQPQ